MLIDAVAAPVFQMRQPQRELRPLVAGDRRVDQRVRQELAALLDVDAVLDGVRQHLGDDVEVLSLGVRVAGSEQRKVRQQVVHRVLLRLVA